jgi:hypothetical protein
MSIANYALNCLVWIDSLMVATLLKKLIAIHSVTMNPRMNLSKHVKHEGQFNKEHLTCVNRCSSSGVSTTAALSGSTGVSIPLLVVPAALQLVPCGLSIIRPSKSETLQPATSCTRNTLGGVPIPWHSRFFVAVAAPEEDGQPGYKLRPSSDEHGSCTEHPSPPIEVAAIESLASWFGESNCNFLRFIPAPSPPQRCRRPTGRKSCWTPGLADPLPSVRSRRDGHHRGLLLEPVTTAVDWKQPLWPFFFRIAAGGRRETGFAGRRGGTGCTPRRNRSREGRGEVRWEARVWNNYSIPRV